MAAGRLSTRRPKTSSSGGNAATVLVAIPVFNELGYVDSVLQAVRQYAENILVVDDGSTDGTSAALEKHPYAHVISHETNTGYGQSLIDAFDFAVRQKFDWVITVDCDCQHEPSYIPRFYHEINKDDTDIISGSRYLRVVNSGSLLPPPERVAINRIITHILNESLGSTLTDAFCGFKAYRTAAISRLALTEKGYRLPLQLWILASRAGLRIREIPVPLIYHDSKRSFHGDLEDPERRFNYYIGIIEKEIGCHVRQDTAEPLSSKG